MTYRVKKAVKVAETINYFGNFKLANSTFAVVIKMAFLF